MKAKFINEFGTVVYAYSDDISSEDIKVGNKVMIADYFYEVKDIFISVCSNQSNETIRTIIVEKY